MDPCQWFAEQLRASGEGFAWAVEQVPPERRTRHPPAGLGEWTVARHVSHIAYYEQALALPTMQSWLGGPEPVEYDDNAAWQRNPASAESLLPGFLRVRAEQLALLPRLADLDWHAPRPTAWGLLPLYWVVSKTYQHTAEHINDVLRIALFWDVYEEEVSSE